MVEVPADVVADWTVHLSDLTAGYALEDIYNADRQNGALLPYPTRAIDGDLGDPRKGIKTSKERVTVLLACSAAGDKLKPLVIGKSLKPRCFWGVDMAALPVTYCTNKKAWMTLSLFREWLERLNSKMLLQGRYILLFVDNCGAPDIRLTYVKMLLLPPTQPLASSPAMRGRGATYRNCKNMATNTLVEQMCEEEGVGFVGILCWERRHVYERWPPSKRSRPTIASG